MESSEPDASQKAKQPRSGISLQTLIIASVASAAASFVVARVWGPGTLIGAATAPVVVALVSEFLRRPVRTVAETAKKVPTARIVPAVRERSGAASDPAPGQEASSRTATAPQAHGWRPSWRAALVTGLIAFVIVVGVYTVPDLLVGHSITGNGQPTTFFGASSTGKSKASPTTTVTRTTTTTIIKTTPTTTTPTTTATTPTTSTTSTTPTETQTATTTTPVIASPAPGARTPTTAP